MSSTPVSPSAVASYNSVAKALHWTIALLIIGMLAIGWVMDDLEMPLKFKIIQLHKSFGITILLLSVFRLLWRITHRAPALPAGMAKWEVGAAHATHALFYFLIIAMPFSGWVMASTAPFATFIFGLFPLPHVPFIADMADKREIGHMARGAHENMAFIMAGLIVLHVGAALKHHFIVRDDIVLRMVPRFLGGLLNRLRGQK